MQRCQVCVHENVKEINKSIVKGANLSQLAQEIGVSTDSMYRHSKEHLSRQLRTGAEIALKNTGVNVMNELDDLMSETRQILQKAIERDHSGLALKAVQQLRGNLTLISQIQFAIAQQQSNTLDQQEIAEFKKWQDEKNAWSEDFKKLSKEDRDLLRDVAIKKLSKMNSIEEEEDFRSKSYIMQEYGPRDAEFIEPEIVSIG
jgi:hypothetical protein